MIRIEHNVTTGEIKEIELSDNEVAELEAGYAQAKLKADQEKAEANAKATQRQAILSRLGITEEEARILLGGN